MSFEDRNQYAAFTENQQLIEKDWTAEFGAKDKDDVNPLVLFSDTLYCDGALIVKFVLKLS